MVDRRIKLTQEQIQEIIKLYGLGEHTQMQLASMFNVTQPHINYLIKKHLG